MLADGDKPLCPPTPFELYWIPLRCCISSLLGKLMYLSWLMTIRNRASSNIYRWWFPCETDFPNSNFYEFITPLFYYWEYMPQVRWFALNLALTRAHSSIWSGHAHKCKSSGMEWLRIIIWWITDLLWSCLFIIRDLWYYRGLPI